MDYLVYVEFSAENLQFYLWFKDYVRRFETLPEKEKTLSPEFIPGTDDIPDLTKDPEKGERTKTKRETSNALMETGYEGKSSLLNTSTSQFQSQLLGKAHQFTESEIRESPSVTSGSTAVPSDAEVVAQAGLKWQPCKQINSEILKCFVDQCSHHPTHERGGQPSDEALSRIHSSTRTEYLSSRSSTLPTRAAAHDSPFRRRTCSQNCRSGASRSIASELCSMVNMQRQ